MESSRLSYARLEGSHLEAFHTLVQDDHIRRYLLDGQVFPREWSAERIRDSQSLFERRGVGIWMAADKTSGDRVGFCGFLEFPSMHPDPQLVYALLERYTGKGYATEMARASIEEARTKEGFATILAGVDEVNGASHRILRKLGFEPISVERGAFGNMLLLRLGPDPDSGGLGG